VEAAASGYTKQRRSVYIPRGGQVTTTFNLVSIVPPPPPPPTVKVRIYGSVTSASTGQVIPSGETYGSGPETWESHIVDGAYDSGEVEAGKYLVEASAPGYVTKTVEADGSAGGNLEVNMTLEVAAPPEMGKIGGQVTDKITTDAVDNARIDIGLRTYYTAANGTWESGDLEPYTYTVRASKSGYVEQTQNVTVIANQVTTADFILEPTEVRPTEFDCTKPPQGYGFFQPLVTAIWYLFCPIIKGVFQVFSPVFDWFKWFASEREKHPAILDVQKQVTEIQKIIDPTQYSHSPLTVEEAKAAADKAGGAAFGASMTLWAAHAFAQAASLGQYKAIRDLPDMALQYLPLDEIISMQTTLPFQVGWTPYLERYWRKFYRPTLQPEDVVDQMYLRGDIDVTLWNDFMAQYGYNEDYISKKLKRIGQTAPHELGVTDEGFPDFWNERGILPGLQDMIQIRTREKIGAKQFERYAAFHGLDAYWVKKIYRASMAPPGLDDFITFNYRYPDKAYPFEKIGPIANLDVDFADIFKERFTIDPPLSIVRFMFETGAITEDKVPPLVRLARYREEYIEPVSKFLTGFQERTWRRRYVMTMATGLRQGKKTETDVRTACTEAKFTTGVADWIVKTSNLQAELAKKEEKEPKEKLVPFTLAVEMWARDIWDESDMKEQIDQLAYEDEDRTDLLELARQRMEEKRAKLAKGEETEE